MRTPRKPLAAAPGAYSAAAARAGAQYTRTVLTLRTRSRMLTDSGSHRGYAYIFLHASLHFCRSFHLAGQKDLQKEVIHGQRTFKKLYAINVSCGWLRLLYAPKSVLSTSLRPI